MGKLIRAAREETGYSQRELAELIYRRQAALSDIENGKMEPDSSTLLLLSHYLEKPIGYFFPPPWKPSIDTSLSDLEDEALLLIKKLDEDDLRRLLAQIRALVTLKPK
ncbi:MAG: hypothetical protein A2X24_12955 [Chloroflexi bacterium GWB2_54_36]|nr:MAG: hypothetical protein A2X24_12955 [Chloroflexi bacterium GWB2_54_36]